MKCCLQLANVSFKFTWRWVDSTKICFRNGKYVHVRTPLAQSDDVKLRTEPQKQPQVGDVKREWNNFSCFVKNNFLSGEKEQNMRKMATLERVGSTVSMLLKTVKYETKYFISRK